MHPCVGPSLVGVRVSLHECTTGVNRKIHKLTRLLNAKFNGSSYLSDDTAHLETDYVKALATVLVVDIDGTSLYPDLSR